MGGDFGFWDFQHSIRRVPSVARVGGAQAQRELSNENTWRSHAGEARRAGLRAVAWYFLLMPTEGHFLPDRKPLSDSGNEGFAERLKGHKMGAKRAFFVPSMV